MGLYQAGFDVDGVDIDPQPNYPFRFIQANALEFPLEGYALLWASPMCQDHSKTRKILEGKGLKGKGGGDQIGLIRARLIASGLPYVIENVPGAPLINPITLCGTMFDLKVIRHRRFEASFPIAQPKCGKHGNTNSHRGYSTGGEFITVGGNNFRRVEGAAAMGIDWMKTRPELAQAIPPAYAKYIGEQAMQYIITREAFESEWELRELFLRAIHAGEKVSAAIARKRYTNTGLEQSHDRGVSAGAQATTSNQLCRPMPCPQIPHRPGF